MASAAPVSVVIPTYNRSRLVARAVSSVVRAARNRFYEVIVVDDCSDDLAALNSSVSRFENATLIKKPRRTSAADSRNIGFDAARYNHVFFLDSDDEFLGGHIDDRLEFNRQCPSGITFGTFTVVDARGVKQAADRSIDAAGDPRDHASVHPGDFVASTISIDRSRYKGTLFDAAQTDHEDCALAISAFDQGETLGFDPTGGVYHHLDDANRRSSQINVAAGIAFMQRYLATSNQKQAFLRALLADTVKRNDVESFEKLVELAGRSEFGPVRRRLVAAELLAGKAGLFPVAGWAAEMKDKLQSQRRRRTGGELSARRAKWDRS